MCSSYYNLFLATFAFFKFPLVLNACGFHVCMLTRLQYKNVESKFTKVTLARELLPV